MTLILSPAMPISDRYLWLCLGVFTFAAVRGISYGLRQIYDLTAITEPSSLEEPRRVSQETEDSVKLESLQTLATCPNADIRRAATKILCDRVINHPTTIPLLTSDLLSRDPAVRSRALKALHFLDRQFGSTGWRAAPPRLFSSSSPSSSSSSSSNSESSLCQRIQQRLRRIEDEVRLSTTHANNTQEEAPTSSAETSSRLRAVRASAARSSSSGGAGDENDHEHVNDAEGGADDNDEGGEEQEQEQERRRRRREAFVLNEGDSPISLADIIHQPAPAPFPAPMAVTATFTTNANATEDDSGSQS